MMTTRAATRLTIGMMLCARLASAQGGLTGLTLDELERRALESSPTLVQAGAQVVAAEGRASQAGRWPNPTIGYTAEEVSNSATIRGGEHGMFIEQVFPISGRLGATRDVLLREVDQAGAVQEGQRQRVLNAVRTLYYDALIAGRRVELRDQLAALAEEAVAVSRRLVNVGAADQTDLLASEIEAQQVTLLLEEARHDETRIWRQLGQVVGEPMLRVQPLAGDPDAVWPMVALEEVSSTLTRESPQLRSARAGVERARAALRRALREPKPDLVVRAGPRYNRELLDPGPNPVGWEFFADVGVSVPLWNRNRNGIAAAEAGVQRATAEVTRLELSLRSRLAEVYQSYDTATTRVRVYRDEVVPRAAESHRLFLFRYEEMAAAYPQVLIAQRTLLQVTEEYLEALATGWRASVQLEGMLLDGALEAPFDPSRE